MGFLSFFSKKSKPTVPAPEITGLIFRSPTEITLIAKDKEASQETIDLMNTIANLGVDGKKRLDVNLTSDKKSTDSNSFTIFGRDVLKLTTKLATYEPPILSTEALKQLNDYLQGLREKLQQPQKQQGFDFSSQTSQTKYSEIQPLIAKSITPPQAIAP